MGKVRALLDGIAAVSTAFRGRGRRALGTIRELYHAFRRTGEIAVQERRLGRLIGAGEGTNLIVDGNKLSVSRDVVDSAITAGQLQGELSRAENKLQDLERVLDANPDIVGMIDSDAEGALRRIEDELGHRPGSENYDPQLEIDLPSGGHEAPPGRTEPPPGRTEPPSGRTEPPPGRTEPPESLPGSEDARKAEMNTLESKEPGTLSDSEKERLHELRQEQIQHNKDKIEEIKNRDPTNNRAAKRQRKRDIRDRHKENHNLQRKRKEEIDEALKTEPPRRPIPECPPLPADPECAEELANLEREMKRSRRGAYAATLGLGGTIGATVLGTLGSIATTLAVVGGNAAVTCLANPVKCAALAAGAAEGACELEQHSEFLQGIVSSVSEDMDQTCEEMVDATDCFINFIPDEVFQSILSWSEYSNPNYINIFTYLKENYEELLGVWSWSSGPSLSEITGPDAMCKTIGRYILYSGIVIILIILIIIIILLWKIGIFDDGEEIKGDIRYSEPDTLDQGGGKKKKKKKRIRSSMSILEKFNKYLPIVLLIMIYIGYSLYENYTILQKKKQKIENYRNHRNHKNPRY